MLEQSVVHNCFLLVALSKLIKVMAFAQKDNVHASGGMFNSSTTQTHTRDLSLFRGH